MVTLKDLRFRREIYDSGGTYKVERPATITDLIEVLQAEGFVVRKPESKSQAKRIAIQQGRCCE